MNAHGHFDISLTPAAPHDAAAEIGRLIIAKQYHGDLEASGSGEMLAVRTTVDGSAGYVAMERVVGRLAGRQGSFALQHTGVMDHGAQSLTIAIVPDSGRDDLTGISGTLSITPSEGRHDYQLEYSLP